MLKIFKSKTIADIGLVYAAAIWGSTFFIVKYAIKDIDPVILTAYRFILTTIFFALILLWQKKTLFTNFKTGMILGLLLWVIYIPQTIGLKYTTAANSGFITGLFIIFVPLFAWLFLKNKPSLTKISAVFLSLIGLWILTGGGMRGINIGDLLTILTAMAYAGHLLCVDKFVNRNIDIYILNFQQFFVGCVLCFITALCFKLPFTFTSINTLWIILFLTAFPTISAFIIQLWAQKIVAPIRVALILALEPAFGAIFAWTLGGEHFFVHQLIGGLLIFSAMLLSEVSLPKSKQ